ncbi:hypothetical protein JOD64_006048 [Micromonospora luteifusca]|uniref:Uncharacterized protein n=1 Tax=Micromonospora luteifusca TaxID=709860 RepID=A0ABS2M367_9ACTN|nr:hypothetical protein [Micromonospora luteifusca]MBM7494826.1 hypothetical protein [Micromonospora luteifusca]
MEALTLMWLYAAPSPTISPGGPPADQAASTVCLTLVVASVAIAIFAGISSAAKSKQRFADAQRRSENMTDQQLLDLERQILSRLHRDHGRAVTVAALSAAIGQPYEDTCLATHRLIDHGFSEIVEKNQDDSSNLPKPDPRRRPERHEEIKITQAGHSHFQRLVSTGEISVNGDYINAPNGRVINRSTIINSFNELEKKYDEATLQALLVLERAVVETGSAEAKELFESFSAEMQSDKPKPPVAKALLRGALEAVPIVGAVAAAVEQIYNAIAIS